MNCITPPGQKHDKNLACALSLEKNFRNGKFFRREKLQLYRINKLIKPLFPQWLSNKKEANRSLLWKNNFV